NRYGNNKSFSDMLKDIINALSGVLFGFLQGKKIDLFIKKVGKVRNILTHPKDNNDKKDNGYITYIYPMTRKLEILLLSLILKEIGFRDEMIRDIFMKKSELQYYFRDHNWGLEPGKFII
ncbi:MAG: HEPN domain-containing protein, partial [Thiobacillus sp.]